jgi:hypothetical protein
VSKIEEIERVIERLPVEDFEKLSVWMAQRNGVSGQQAKPVRVEAERAGRGPNDAGNPNSAWIIWIGKPGR